MNELQIFENSEFGKIRMIEIEREPYFVGKDVTEILGYERGTKATVDHVDEDDRIMIDSKTQSQFGIELGQRGGWLINESGLYSLVIDSKLPSAKKFKRWVTSEVLPSIRKYGMYAKEELLDNPDLLISVAQELKIERERNKALKADNDRMKPKEVFADAVSVSDTAILIGELAKILKQNGVNIGQNRLFEWMRDNGYLIKRKGTDYNMPMQKSMEMGLFEIKERIINNPDGSVRITKTVLVSGKGQQYFINKFLGAA